MSVRSFPRTLMVYGLCGALCTLTLLGQFGLWRGNLEAPLEYTSRGDAYFNYMVVKTVLEGDWVHTNASLGAPGEMELYDFPMTNDLNLLMIKGLGCISPDAFQVVNLFYLGTFLLASWTALFAFLRCGVSEPLALGGALTFGFLPYHFHRGQNHLFLSSYMAIPPIGLVVLWVAEGRPLFLVRDERTRRLRFRCGTEAAIAAVACLLLGGSDVYYAFFGSFLAITAGMMAWLRFRSRAGVLDALVLVVLISGLVLASIAPCLLHGWRSGFNPVPTKFGYMEAEIYGLRIANLIKPAPGHWIYSLVHPGYTERPINENRYSYIGVSGVLGFLSLLMVLMTHRPLEGRLGPLLSLSRLNIAAVLLGTTGGFGLLFARMISPQIRAYNRICIVIAFYSVLAFLLLLEALRERVSAAGPRRALTMVMTAWLLGTGLVSQAPLTARPNFRALAESFTHDRAFIESIESSLPPRAMVFQLPYLAMPEASEKPRRMGPYAHLRGYLHSRRLRWSYGAIHGRSTARWQEELAKTPPAAMVAALRKAGFAGIYLDRRGYRDKAEQLETGFRKVLGSEPLSSGDGRFLFFKLDPTGATAADPAPVAAAGS
jgi:phosphoglycerol transferase